MAGITKYAPINGGSLISDIKSHFSIFKTRKTVTFAYAFFFIFLAFTIFLAFSPSSNIFTVSSTSPTSQSSVLSDQSYRSHFSSIYYYFFPNSLSSSSSPASSPHNSSADPSVYGNRNSTNLPSVNGKNEEQKQNQSRVVDKDEVLKANQSSIGVGKSPNSTVNSSPNSANLPSVNGKNEEMKQNQSRVHEKEGILKANQSSAGVSISPNNTVNSSPNSANLPSVNGKHEEMKQNQSRVKDEVLKVNQSSIGVSTSPNKTVNHSAEGEKGIAEKGVLKNLTSSLRKEGNDELIKSLINCDLFDGNWVKDESYPLYKPGSCSLIDEQFNCFRNGRPDNGYYKMKWKPKGCTLPRLDGSHMLEMLRGKRLVFVGDSLNRNMWESLVCILRNSVKDKKKVYEENGRHHFRSEVSYSFVFEDYKSTVEFFVAPFLVQEWEVTGKNGVKKETLRLDMVNRAAEKYKKADIIVFNTGHWWTHEKTSTGKDYYQEGSHVYSDLNVLEAFRKAITTWGRWIDANVNPRKSLVFFRGYSASHFSGGQWNSGGQCDHETEPIKNETYLTPYPRKMTVLERVLKGMKTRPTYLNITRMTDYRKDGHPSIYRKLHMSEVERRSPFHYQDCSHWCLPGVPDAWNEILYAELLVKLNQKQ